MFSTLVTLYFLVTCAAPSFSGWFSLMGGKTFWYVIQNSKRRERTLNCVPLADALSSYCMLSTHTSPLLAGVFAHWISKAFPRLVLLASNQQRKGGVVMSEELCNLLHWVVLWMQLWHFSHPCFTYTTRKCASVANYLGEKGTCDCLLGKVKRGLWVCTLAVSDPTRKQKQRNWWSLKVLSNQWTSPKVTQNVCKRRPVVGNSRSSSTFSWGSGCVRCLWQLFVASLEICDFRVIRLSLCASWQIVFNW